MFKCDFLLNHFFTLLFLNYIFGHQASFLPRERRPPPPSVVPSLKICGSGFQLWCGDILRVYQTLCQEGARTNCQSQILLILPGVIINDEWKYFSLFLLLYIYKKGFTRHIILKITPSTQRIILPRINTFKIVPVPTITSTIYFFLLKINLYINFKLLVTILLYNSLNWCYNKGCLTRNIPKQWPCTLKSYWMF